MGSRSRGCRNPDVLSGGPWHVGAPGLPSGRHPPCCLPDHLAGAAYSTSRLSRCSCQDQGVSQEEASGTRRAIDRLRR